MAKFKGSRTEKNLLTAFAGESQARNRYTFFAGQAKKEGYIQIAAIFEETANQEREHAKRFFKFLNGGEVEIQWAFPAGIIAPTRQNLLAAADGERYEHSEMYPGFAKIAEDEGFAKAADAWAAISVSERQHEKRFRELAGNLAADRVFRREAPVVWRCINCGYLHEGEDAPQECPACIHPQGHFEILGENW